VQCDGRSLDIGTSPLAFIKSHTLMEYTVDTLDGVPVYYTKHDLAATRLAVLHSAKYAIFFIGSSECRRCYDDREFSGLGYAR